MKQTILLALNVIRILLWDTACFYITGEYLPFDITMLGGDN